MTLFLFLAFIVALMESMVQFLVIFSCFIFLMFHALPMVFLTLCFALKLYYEQTLCFLTMGYSFMSSVKKIVVFYCLLFIEQNTELVLV